MYTVIASTVLGEQIFRDRTLDQAVDLTRVMAENNIQVTILPVETP